jgi:SAM-dependent methyltransferase
MSEKKIVAEGYNAIAELYLERRTTDLKELQLLPLFIKEVPSQSRVLDVGCGGGTPFTQLLTDHFEVIGVDISFKQLLLAKKNVPKAHFLCGDIVNQRFPKASFAGIFSYYAIIHIPREEHLNLFQNFYRILQPSGIMLVCLMGEEAKSSMADDFFGEKMFWSGFTPQKSVEIIEKAGFTIEWQKMIDDSLGDAQHLFVLAKKNSLL